MNQLDTYSVAVLLAVMFNRSKQHRARIAQDTLKQLAGRSRITPAFVRDLREELAEGFGLEFIQLKASWAMFPAKSLEGAKTIGCDKALSLLQDARGLNGEFDFAALQKELENG